MESRQPRPGCPTRSGPDTGNFSLPYWYNVDTKSVESDETRGQERQCHGSLATEAEARQAIEACRENTERWDGEDRESGTPKGATPVGRRGPED